MNVAHEGILVTTYRHESRRAFDEYVHEAGVKCLVIGEGGADSLFTSFTFTRVMERNHPRVRIGTISSRVLGREPEVCLLPAHDAVLLSLEYSVVRVSLREMEVVFRVDCEGPVYSPFYFPDFERYVIVHELGAVCVNGSGDVLWRRETNDIVTDYWVAKHTVYLAVASALTVRVRCK